MDDIQLVISLLQEQGKRLTKIEKLLDFIQGEHLKLLKAQDLVARKVKK